MNSGAQRCDLPFELGQRVRQLLPARVVSGRLKLPAELGVRQPERFDMPDLLGITVGLVARAARALLFAFVHAFLNPVLRVD